MGLLSYIIYNIGILSHNQKYLPHNTEITKQNIYESKKKNLHSYSNTLCNEFVQNQSNINKYNLF